MHNEFRVMGPPGTGKTTYLAKQIEHAAEKHGSDNVVVASYTKAAATELNRRQLPIPRENIGTLHALCYRGLKQYEIAEVNAKEFNEAYPQDAISVTGSSQMDEMAADAVFATDGDKHLNDYNLWRAKCLDLGTLPPRTIAWLKKWESWKLNNHYIDFTDMISITLSMDEPMAGEPIVGIYDECQDFNKLEMRLVRHWSKYQDHIIMAGDDDQTLYNFCGASPDAFLYPEVAADHKRVLNQSWRLPRKIHEFSQQWIKKIQNREPKEFNPKAEEGSVTYINATYKTPNAAIDLAERYTRDGKTVMLLTTCGYLLNTIKAELRSAGLPFHNPYRCSPPDEKVLTNYGWVEMQNLDPAQHKVAGFYAHTNALSWGGKSGSKQRIIKNQYGTSYYNGKPTIPDKRGFEFSVSKKFYDGQMITITTSKSKTRVTPNHRVHIRYSDEFYDKWLVYLMKRGINWRIGMCKSGSKPFINGSITGRLTTERGECAWLLGIYETKIEAMSAEAFYQAHYGITGLTFRAHPKGNRVYLKQDILDRLHNGLTYSDKRARQLLADHGLLIDHPFYRGDRTRRTGFAFETVAANLVNLTGYLEMPVMPAKFENIECERVNPEWYNLNITTQHYRGEIYSLDVPGPEHYISGHAVVHNSTRGDWNPMGTFHSQRSGRVSTRERILAFLDSSIGVSGNGYWNADKLSKWIELIRIKGILKKGAKERITTILEDRDGWIDDEATFYADIFEPYALEKAMQRDLAWFDQSLLAAKRSAVAYPLTVFKKQGIKSLEEKPKLIIGTVHSVKGGESDCVILFPDMSAAAMEDYNHNPDATIRTFYVGMTRAKESLVICKPYSNMSVKLN